MSSNKGGQSSRQPNGGFPGFYFEKASISRKAGSESETTEEKTGRDKRKRESAVNIQTVSVKTILMKRRHNTPFFSTPKP
jgi:hypothetical protein